MASTVTQFPPPTYSSSYFLRNVIKEDKRKDAGGLPPLLGSVVATFLSKRLTHTPSDKKAADSASGDDPPTGGDKGLDLSDLWRTRTSKKETSSSFKQRFRRNHGDRSSSPAHAEKDPPSPTGEERSLLKFLALNALDLTAPASDILLKNRQNSWFQLSGHPDCFAPAGPGTIWKKRSGGPENAEAEVYEALAADPAMRDVVPQYFREVEYGGQKFIELQDLLHGFTDPHVMDVKMGTRTFLESEVQKSIARNDLYLKMIDVDPTAPTPDEHHSKAVTKLRYMQFREQQSSTCSQGFRMEALKFRGSPPVKDLKKVKSREEVMVTMALFLGGREDTRQRLVTRLKEIREKFEQSTYFQRHEVVGSSIFMIYDDTKVGAWIIDFAKTLPIPNGTIVNHRTPWVQGNHEEGFLYGLDSLISIMEEVDLTKPLPVDNTAQVLSVSTLLPLKS